MADGRDAVSFHLLEHDGRGDDGCVSVVAGAAGADAVAVDFVDHVACAVVVAEVSGVDCATNGLWTDGGGRLGGVRTGDCFGCCDADAVVAWI